MLKGQALNQLIFVVLVDTNVSKGDAYVCVVEYLHQCNRVVCLAGTCDSRMSFVVCACLLLPGRTPSPRQSVRYTLAVW